ncbi:MAG: TonB-dependent receptor, partial [Crocinitomicaceae bacterium]|nr:TonB-dependent receptor [Crocinitomicaceae bacterium]
TSEGTNDNIFNTEMSVEKLDIGQIKKMPALLGEVDVIKAIQLLPGVATVGEGGSGFYVRGGGVDQNLILLDEANVYNASHLLGFFSVFNPDIVKDVQLYKGGIPAEYGGRLSSVLDIRMVEGNYKQFALDGGIGTISSRLTFGGPIVKDKGSFVLAGRRTYADIFLPLSKREELRDNRLYFYDFNAKANYKLNDNNRIYFSGYGGRDVFEISDAFTMNWGNTSLAFRWNHVISDRWFSNTTFTYSNYDYFLSEPTGQEAFEWSSNIKDYYLKEDITFFMNTNNTFKAGGLVAYHAIDPGIAVGVDSSILDEFRVPLNYGLEYAGYISHEWKIGERFRANYGLRFSAFQNIGETTVYGFDDEFVVNDTTEYGKWETYNFNWGLEPRLGMTFLLSETSSLKASYNRTIQYIQLASNGTASSPLDVWFMSSPNVKPQIADQYALGYFQNFKEGMYQSSVEVYYKDIQNAIDFEDHATLLLNPYLEGELRTGRAWSYGAEFLVKKTKGKFTGWLGYTLSRTMRQIEEINNGNPYLANYDKTHDLSLIMAYDITDQFSVSTNFVYGTGAAVTMPIGKYEYMGMLIPIYSDRNAKRMPDYHRLDFAFTYKRKPKEGKRWRDDWVLSVYNVYNRANAYSINFRQDEANPSTTKAEMLYLFGIVPSITYNFHF